MKSKKSLLQGFVSFLFAFLLTLAFIALYLCAGTNIGVFSSKSITKAINESNYYNNVYDALKKSSEDTLLSVGLPSSVITEVITLQRVYIGGKNYVGAALRGSTTEINTDKLHSELLHNIDLYLQEEGIVRTTTLDTGIDEVVTSIETKYKAALQLQLVNSLQEYKTEYNSLLKISLPIIIVLIVLLCFLLIKLHTYVHRGLRYIAYALIASTLMIAISSGILLITKQYTGVNASPGYYKDFVMVYLQWDIMVFLYIAGIGMTIAIALISSINYLKNRIGNN